MAGLNLTHQATCGDTQLAALRGLGNRTGAVLADLLAFYRGRTQQRMGAPFAFVHDACAIAAVAEPDIVAAEAMHVAIELTGRHTYGMTVCDRRWEGREPIPGVTPEANVAVGMTLDRDRFWRWVLDTLATYP
jgi:inosine-uridine nucleoside N-ribohydrolase